MLPATAAVLAADVFGCTHDVRDGPAKCPRCLCPTAVPACHLTVTSSLCTQLLPKPPRS